MSPLLIQTDIESEIVRLADLLEEATEQQGAASQDWAEKEAEYKYAFARAYRSEEGPEHIRKQDAMLVTHDLYKESLVAEARKSYLIEKCRQLRAQLDAVRTLSANVRVQT